MLRLTDMKAVGRAVRRDEPETLGRPTQELVCEAIDAGRLEDAKRLARYMVPEGKSLHDLFCDWIWQMLTAVAERQGEEEMYGVMRASQETWFMKRTWKGFLSMAVEARVQLTAEVMRAHHCGPDQDGAIEVVEDDEKYSIRMDPCGSGGRMRRGDPVDGTPSRLGPPYGFGATQEAHDWSWGKRNVPYYCVHCALNELLPMEWGGHPLWVTGYDEDASRPCVWHFYKRADDIPEEFYRRLGRDKPGPGEGQY